MQDSKHIINIYIEQSKILEKFEELKQLILLSSLTQTDKIKYNNKLSAMIYEIYEKYEDKIETQNKIGDI